MLFLVCTPFVGGCTSTNSLPASGAPEIAFTFAPSDDPEHINRKKRLQGASGQFTNSSAKIYEYFVQKGGLSGSAKDTGVLRLVFEERVFFDTGRSKIRPDAAHVLNIVAAALREESEEVSVFVTGHTDNRGSDKYNLKLSVNRADAVAVALSRRGVGTAKVWRVGFGKAVPLHPNDSAANMALNRRVEFVFASRPEAASWWLSKQPHFLCSEGTNNNDELCRETLSLTDFTATPVVAGVPQTRSAARADVRLVDQAQTPKLINVLLSPPIIQQVGRPQQ